MSAAVFTNAGSIVTRALAYAVVGDVRRRRSF
jgi:hypothetical protein